MNAVTIENVNVINTTTTSCLLYCGGLIGRADTSNISSINISGTFSSGGFGGGLVGYITDSTMITNSFSNMSTSAGSHIGGLVGWNSASSINILDVSYATSSTQLNDL